MAEERKIGKLGRLEPARPEGLHMLSFYQHNPLPKPPIVLEVPKVLNWGMMGNDHYGDCTFAGIGHAKLSTATVLGIQEAPLSTDEVVQAYLKYTNNQDIGAVEADLLNYWKNNELFGGKIVAYAPTDIADQEELKSVIAAYGLAYIGVKLSSVAEEQFSQHKPWTLTGTTADQNIIGGHCIILVGYDREYFYAITWGAIQPITWIWLQSYMDESWAIITPEIVEKGEYKNIRLEDLITDIEKLS